MAQNEADGSEQPPLDVTDQDRFGPEELFENTGPIEFDESQQVVIEYEYGTVRRRDVFTENEKRVEQYDYTNNDGEEVWELVVAYPIKRPSSLFTERDPQ